jgi:two-component system CitB family sensor kinase
LHSSDYDSAREVIERVNEESERALDSWLARIRDPAVVGILVGKGHQAREVGVELAVTPDSSVPSPCPHREAVVTIVGNAVANALEALQAMPVPPARPEVRVTLRDEPDQLVVEVRDNGPGLPPAGAAALFEAGVSTKGPGRGIGLAIVARLVRGARGEVALEDTGAGARFRATLPREGAA